MACRRRGAAAGATAPPGAQRSRSTSRHVPPLLCAPSARVVAEVLRAIIGTYRELFKAPALTEAGLFSNYALTALVVDEVCREVGPDARLVCVLRLVVAWVLDGGSTRAGCGGTGRCNGCRACSAGAAGPARCCLPLPCCRAWWS